MRKILIAAVIVTIPLFLGILAYFYFTSNVSYKDVGHVADVSGLAVVLPTKLPANSKVLSGPTFDSKTGSITTSFSVNQHEVVVSQQKRPDTDLKQIDTQDTFLVNAGSVYVLKGEAGRLQAIVETSDSWLMVNADADLGVREFKNFLELLEEY